MITEAKRPVLVGFVRKMVETPKLIQFEVQFNVGEVGLQLGSDDDDDLPVCKHSVHSVELS